MSNRKLIHYEFWLNQRYVYTWNNQCAMRLVRRMRTRRDYAEVTDYRPEYGRKAVNGDRRDIQNTRKYESVRARFHPAYLKAEWQMHAYSRETQRGSEKYCYTDRSTWKFHRLTRITSRVYNQTLNARRRDKLCRDEWPADYLALCSPTTPLLL
jgi:hypothetical protein